MPIIPNPLARSASGPSIRGKLAKGNNFDGLKVLNLTKAKVLDLE